MKIHRYVVLLALVFLICMYPLAFAIASGPKAQKIDSIGTDTESVGPQKQGKSQIYLNCDNGNVRFSIQWNNRIGTPGKYLRHVFLPTDMGDTHILLKVLRDRTSTGIIDNDSQAKSLIKHIIDNIGTSGAIEIEIFPEDRDPDTGEWDSCIFDAAKFLKSAKSVAKQCNWDITKPMERKFRTVEASQ